MANNSGPSGRKARKWRIKNQNNIRGISDQNTKLQSERDKAKHLANVKAGIRPAVTFYSSLFRKGT